MSLADTETRLQRLEYLRDNGLIDIRKERERQFRLKAQGRFTHTPDEVSLLRSYLMLAEELGEVAEAIQGYYGYIEDKFILDDIRKELIQVAAIALAIVEGIDYGDE